MNVCPACSREFPPGRARCPDDGVALVALGTATRDRPEDLLGVVIDGRYRIERIIGRGGMGTVFACRHVVVGKPLAMKVLQAGVERSEGVLQRFVREAQAASAIRSRHIVEIIDFGQLPNGCLFLVMELLEGEDLTKALRGGRLSRADLLHVFVQMAEALGEAHEQGIVHRDLKPDNVLLVRDGDDPLFVKLLDFGIAKMIDRGPTGLTETGVILGTPYYMSPEQARGDPVDHRADIYALGIIMYRAFTGRLPFVADTTMGVLAQHLMDAPEPPSRVAPVDRTIEAVILRCLEKRPIDRFQSMRDVADALRFAASHAPAPGVRDDPTIDETDETDETRGSTRPGGARADRAPEHVEVDDEDEAPTPASRDMLPRPLPVPATFGGDLVPAPAPALAWPELTQRGVVTSSVHTTGPGSRSGRAAAIIGGGSLVAAALGAGLVVLVFGRAGETPIAAPPPDTASSVPAASATGEPGAEPSSFARAVDLDEPVPAASEELPGLEPPASASADNPSRPVALPPVSPRPSASPKAPARSAGGGAARSKPPPPRPAPTRTTSPRRPPEIRSPFD